MFIKNNTTLEGCFLLNPTNFNDLRGSFTKIFHEDFYKKNNLRSDFKEEYYSISKPNVFRGLHFQYPPMDHAKLVTCLSGSVLDILVDLRKSSSTFMNVYTAELNEKNKSVLYIPSGIAHGFLVNSSKDALMLYNVTSVFSSECDGGINLKYVKEYLPNIKELIVSDKDLLLPKIQNFINPF